MKEIRLETFFNLDDAMLYLETNMSELNQTHEDVKGEVELFDERYRVCVTGSYRQAEFRLSEQYDFFNT